MLHSVNVNVKNKLQCSLTLLHFPVFSLQIECFFFGMDDRHIQTHKIDGSRLFQIESLQRLNATFVTFIYMV